MSTPVVSIGLPVYNGAEYLQQSLDSLVGQTFRDIELVISDNASTDDTGAICQALAARDPRVRYSRLDHNIGGVANHNRVASLATGRYFMWAASDDIWQPSYVQRCVDVLESDPGAVVAYAINARMDEHGQPIDPVEPGPSLAVDDPVERFWRSTAIHRAIEPFYGLVRRDALARVPPFVRHPGFDRILFAELALLGKLVQIDQPLYVRRIHMGQSVGTHPSLRSRYRWISPDRNPRWVFPHFEYAGHFTAAVLRSAPGLGARLRCLVRMAKWCHWHKAHLWQDLASSS